MTALSRCLESALVFAAAMLLAYSPAPPRPTEKMETPDPLLVDVSLESSEEEQFRLRISLEYRGDVPVAIYRASLPWATVQSLLLVAVKLDALGTVIEQVFPIDDPGSERITLTPGQMLEGTISLNERFPDLANARRKRDVMIFWTYQLETVDDGKFERASGSVLLPKGRTTDNR